jgi:hypothetical protein
VLSCVLLTSRHAHFFGTTSAYTLRSYQKFEHLAGRLAPETGSVAPLKPDCAVYGVRYDV